MAYDRYDTRRGSRERWRADERYSRDRDFDDRDERGFFERAGDEIASWFGDDDAERRRRQDYRGEGRDYGRDRDYDPPRALGREGRWDRDDDARRSWRDDDDERGFLGSSSYRGYSGEGREQRPMRNAERYGERSRSYRPMTGDYGRSEHRAFDRGQFRREDERRMGAFGSSDRRHDPHYAEWRNRQIDELDRDYDEYRRENQSRFESDFGDWRTRRQGKRQMLGQVREHMEVVGSDDEHVGTVDRVAGDRVILTKSDPEAGGVHHSLPCTMIDEIDGDRIKLDCKADDAKQKWRDESRERALFEREDQGEAGPGILDRSFSGTYR